MASQKKSVNMENESGNVFSCDEFQNNIYSPTIVVDLDGTLTPTDTLIESVIQMLKSHPLTLLLIPVWLLQGKASFKCAVAARSDISIENLPYLEPLLSYLRSEKENGRRLVLATAAHKSIAKNVSTYLGFFDDVLATDENCNLKGRVKLEAILEKFGRDFVYAGDNQADVPIWKAAKGAILVGVPVRLAESIRCEVPIEREFSKERLGLGVWLRALRVHQWSKNSLLFVPLLTAFSFMELSKLVTMFIAFIAFSLAASATYIVNDLLDLESDRVHPRKRFRPFANAEIPILQGITIAGLSLIFALILASTISQNFFLMLLSYLVLTSAYSWMLKKYVLIDVLMLSLLYTLRILAGSVAIGIVTSSWLLAFSVFMFLSLALVKRCSELVALGQLGTESTFGRDYRVSDLAVLWPLGVGSALSSVVVFGLFINAPDTQIRYATPALLWLVAIGLIYWLARLWVKTSRGEMHDDPVIYAIKDYGSCITVVTMLLTTLLAHFLRLDIFL